MLSKREEVMRSQHTARTTFVLLLALTIGAGVVWAVQRLQPGGLSDSPKSPPSSTSAFVDPRQEASDRAQGQNAEERSRHGGREVVGDHVAQHAGTPVAVQRSSRLDLYGDPLPDGAIARMGTTRFHSDDELYPVFALSHDGALFASAAPDDKVRVCERLSGRVLLNIDTGPRVRETTGLGKRGGVLGFSHAGRFLLVRTVADNLELWEIASGKRAWKTPIKQESSFDRAVFSKDDKRILGWERWGVVLVALAVADGKEIGRYTVPERVGRFDFPIVPGDGPVTGVPVAGHLHVWDVVSGARIGDIQLDCGPLYMSTPFALTPSGRLAAFQSRGAKCTVLRDVATRTDRTIQVPYRENFHLDFSPDGRTLLHADRERKNESDPCAFLYDVASGKLLGRMDPDPGEDQECAPSGRARTFLWRSPSVVFSADSRLLAWRNNRAVRLWDIARGKQVWRRVVSAAQRSAYLEFSGDGRILAVQEGKTIRFFDGATGDDSPPRPGHSDEVTQFVFSDDGKLLASGGLDGMIGVWETATGKPLQRLPDTTSRNGALAFTPDGKKLASFDGEHDQTLRLWDVGTGKELVRCQNETNLQGAWLNVLRGSFNSYLAFFNDGRSLAAGVWYHEPVRFFDVATGKEQKAVNVSVNDAGSDRGHLQGLAISRDGRNLAMSIGQERIDLIDAMTKKTKRSIAMEAEKYASHQAPFFSPDGRIVGVMLRDTVRFFEAASGKPVLVVTPPKDSGVLAATGTPDGKILLIEAAGTPWRICLRDAFSGRRIYCFPIEPSVEPNVSAAAFSADSRWIALAYNDTEIVVWPVNSLLKDAVEQPERLDSGRLEQLWANLAGDDASCAYRAVLSLAHAPEQSVPSVGARLRPAPRPDLTKLRRLVRELDRGDYKVRAGAYRALEEAAEEARPFFRATLAGQCSAETRQRVQRLLEDSEQWKLTPESLRRWRAIMALEQAGTAEAKQVLRNLAAGTPEHWLTREAADSLKRLDTRRAATTPAEPR
jgi:WD40 repeat protein